VKLKFFIRSILAILLIFLLVKSGYVISNTISTIATPYNPIESMYWLLKYATGLSEKNSGIVEAIPNSYTLNKGIKAKYKLIFIGDMMPTGNSFISISPALREFLSDGDYLVANLEGVITESKKGALILVSDRRHTKRIIDMLANIFPPRKIYLSVANNHSGDFGEEEFFESVKMLESQNFNVFGWNERPFADINGEVRIISGTMWSNRPCDYVFMLEGAEDQIKPGAFNFLYPHFGYEFELYPRPAIVKIGKELIQKFDALIGHHSHCPQPISAESVSGVNKLLGYSLGNFFSVRATKKYQYGIVLKVELGQNEEGEWLVGEVQWRSTKSTPLQNGNFVVNLK
jgi:hypothetical protein